MTTITSPPLVSVIVRTKDRLDSLRYCLDSIVKQTYRPIEVVIINDGGAPVLPVTQSLPDTITLQLIELDTNVGRTAAANKGLDHAKGDFLCFLDDDDYWLPHHLDTLVEPLSLASQSPSDNAVGMVYGSTRAVNVDHEGTEHPLSVFETPFNSLQLLKNNFIPIMSALFLRRWVDEGVRFDLQFDLFEDWDFWLQIHQKCQFKHIPAVTSVYRLHEAASGVHDHTLANNAALCIYQKWLPSLSINKIASLIQYGNIAEEERINRLQEENQKQLNNIGKQHSYALKVIQEKDQNIEYLETLYKNAINTIETKDDDIKHLDALYKNAINTIETKDDNINHLDKSYQHAIRVIEEKDIDIERINRDLNILSLRNDSNNKNVEKQNALIEDLNNQVDGLNSHITSLTEELDTIKSTFTWRLHSKIKRLIN
ncbi:glycosyltransferase [Marinomonas sp. 15G1-11]|uniref:Glycosyltransferase n=1 Tax=Marinomonas phaeophyticola TaxID=3004091 RepID=A0ABT4JSQ6_9GAMM|nr:glycosyltransferase [Marinomonas sp. 15G1-11]MCZ2721348.1 glycosyltransferase [Marinomonas sp. 15G1-11]